MQQIKDSFLNPVTAEKPLYYWIIVDEHDKPMPSDGYYYNCTGGDRGLLNARDIKYSFDGLSAYEATVINNQTPWTCGGMWYSLIRTLHDNIPLDFKAIFGPYVKPEYQGEITDIEIVLKSVFSPTRNKNLRLRIELKDKDDRVVTSKEFINLSAGTYTWSLPENARQKIKTLTWIMEKAVKGDSLSVDRIRLRSRVPDLTVLPTREQAFLWTYSWLLTNYDPSTGMVQDRSVFSSGAMENITATAKAAKIAYYARIKGYTSPEDANRIIFRIADTFIHRLPRGPFGKNSLWPHFTCNGGSKVLPPRSIYSGSEWATSETFFAALDLITVLEMLGDPLNQSSLLEDILNEINWKDLLSPQGFLSHGYDYEGKKINYFWEFFGMETLGVNWAYASSTGKLTPMGRPSTYNGSGFIDNAQYPQVFSGLDCWGNNWDLYRSYMADTQTGWYNSPGRNRCLCGSKLFGLSAGEAPEDNGVYKAYGTGGTEADPDDGNSEVIIPHYCGMISDIRPEESKQMWEALRDQTPDFLKDRSPISPLNNAESIRVDKRTGQCTINYLKGSWNLALQAEGWAQADPRIREALSAAVQTNPFLKKGYDLLKTRMSPDTVKPVPLAYSAVCAA